MNTPSLNNEHQLLTSWLAAIGMLTMYWSPVERHIDQYVHLLHRQVIKYGKSYKPTRLGSKLDFIKKNMPIGIINPKQLDNLTNLTKATVKIRDVCVHGELKSYDPQKIYIGKVKGRGDEHIIENFIIDHDRLHRSANALYHLGKEWGSIASELIKYTANK